MEEKEIKELLDKKLNKYDIKFLQKTNSIYDKLITLFAEYTKTIKENETIL